ncbi:MAG: amidohydrolase [Chloroflexi bacterium]|jgi:predicted TIM-barrel fold metal-dependent hydrolase|nr:amidohydrolase family protein [Anaerolineaceae bacterium]NMB90847.1 amidohydrolase [Chloroflexota bacterium]
MIIDFHTHAPERGDFNDFLKGMDENKIDMAVLDALGVTVAEAARSSEYVHSLVQKYPDRLMGFATVMPREPDAAKLFEHYVKDLGFKGLKLHPPMQNFSPIDPLIGPVIEKAIELDVPILFHTGPIYAQFATVAFGDPLLIDQLAIRYPQAKMVMAHGNPLGYDPSIASKHPNVYVDTTLRLAEVTRVMPNIGELYLDLLRGDEKLMFGTDANPTRTWRFKYNLDAIDQMQVPQESKEKILWKTAARLLKLNLN